MSIDSKALPDASAYHVRVALPELSRREILQAVAEYDRLGQDRLLEKYRFGAARSYRLVIDGKTYDSKATSSACTAGSSSGPASKPRPRSCAGTSRS